ncbi:MAG TPA: GNAT family N-acetyltransferase [Gammaproteobacteria bacterium]
MDVKHDPAGGRFYVDVDGWTAHLDYVQVDERTLDLRHTFVPEALRGRGIAAEIVRFALEYARDRGLRVIPTCSYVAAKIRREPEFADLVVE